MRQIHNKPSLKQNRKQLRNHSTPAEAVLWGYLKKGQLEGRKFRRQHSIGNYIADFYCPQERLVIELDGAHHFTVSGGMNDEERDNYLQSLNIRVVRIENRWVFDNPEGVLEVIKSNLRKVG